MHEERRRYFRINDTVDLSYRISFDPNGKDDPTFELIAEQDRRMEILIAEQKHHHPDLVELIALLNQKIERLTHLDRQSKTTIAFKARSVNLSACGLAFEEHEALALGAQLQLFLAVSPETRLEIEGMLVDCQPKDNGHYTWRVDFINLTPATQERLIQQVVQRQSAQLANRQLL